LAAQQLHTGPLEGVQAASLGGDEQRDRIFERASFVLGLRRHQRQLGPPRRVDCQC
jgi:hypothetical protein